MLPIRNGPERWPRPNRCCDSPGGLDEVLVELETRDDTIVSHRQTHAHCEMDEMGWMRGTAWRSGGANGELERF